MVNMADSWDEPYNGSWPILQMIQNAIFHVGKTSPLGQKLQTLLDVLSSRVNQQGVASPLLIANEDNKLKNPPDKLTNERNTQERNEPSHAASTIDVGIVIALKEEFNEFFNEIKTQSKSFLDEETGRYYYLFDYNSADLNHQYHCVAIFVGEMGSVKSSLITQRLISQWKPRTLVMLGIAAALSNDVHIGDVVIASQVDAYLENSKAIPTTGGKRFEFTLSGEVYRSSSDLLHAAQNFEFVYGEIFQDWRVNCMRELQQLVPKVSLEQLLASKQLHDQVQMIDGHLASGPTVGAAPAFKNWLKTRDRKYLALEMEAGGLMAAAYEQADPKRTLVLRGISDDGDEQKKKLDDIEDGAFRRYAMRNVIHLLWRFFDAGILPYNKPQNSPMTSESGALNSTLRNPAAKIEEAKVSSPMAQTHLSTGISKPSRTSAFISYSHKDKKYLDELHVHLAQYVRMEVVDFWDDTKISPGSKWHDEIKKALQLAKVAVILVSADFLASNFIATDELPPLLAAAEQEGAIILPVILRPCAFKDTNLAQFQAVNAPSKPLSNMTRGKREEVWAKVAELIKDTLNIQI
jgi:nucleoside phosphorylase